MSDQLKITSSPLPRETLPKPDAVNNQYTNVSDTTKVIKTTVKDSFGQNKPESGLDFNYQSLSARTLKLLMNSDTATEAVKRLLFNSDAMSLLANGGAESAEMAQFLEAFFLSAEQMPEYLKSQLSNNTLFQGNFFDFLRGLLAQNGNNPQLKNSLLNILKALEIHDNRQNTTIFLINNLNNLLPVLSAKNQQTILQCIELLHQAMQASGDNQGNTSETQKMIMSVLSETAAANKDNTTLRNMVMQAVHNLSRLDNSDDKSLMKAIDTFIANLQQYSKLSPEQKDFLMQAIQIQLAASENGNHQAADQILAALDRGLAPDSSLQIQLASSNILSALLLNNSVLLPLIYGFIPLKLDNTYLFSELWANVEEEKSEKKKGATVKNMTVFFTMESSAFGYMQGIVNAEDKNIAIDLEAPEAALSFLSAMKDYLKPIVADLGFQLNKVNITTLQAPKRFYDVFGKNILKEAYINVRV